MLRIRNLSVNYRDGKGRDVAAVCAATFEVGRGEIVGIFGPSGSGKTSLGLAVLDLLPGTAVRSADAIDFEDINLLRLSEREMRSMCGRRISIMYQEAALSLNPVMKVGDQISEVILVHEACTRRQRRARVIELLGNVGLCEAMYDSYPHELSGGERHRIVIAQALACRPALVIADEPTAGLDPDLKIALLDLILRLRTEMNVSFLVISHDRRMLAQIADRTLQMTAGRPIESRPISHAISSSWRGAFTAPVMAATASEPLLTLHAVSKSFRKNRGLFRPRLSAVQALRDVNVSIARGASFGLTGPSGSGKSTLAKCIAGWEKADSGQILFSGKDLADPARFRIQLLLQDTAAALNPNLTTEEIVTEPLLIHRKGDKKQRRAAVKRLFLEIGLEEDMLTRKPLAFSGGQRQRLAIARALILNPELVIFDESMTGLDTETLEQILKLLSRLKTARNLTYLLISHDGNLLKSFADSIATMRNGTIVSVEPCCAATELALDSVRVEPVAADAQALATGEPA